MQRSLYIRERYILTYIYNYQIYIYIYYIFVLEIIWLPFPNLSACVFSMGQTPGDQKACPGHSAGRFAASLMVFMLALIPLIL